MEGNRVSEGPSEGHREEPMKELSGNMRENETKDVPS